MSGGQAQTYFAFQNANNSRFENNTASNFAFLFYETAAGSTADFYQDGNFTPIASTVSIGTNVRIPPAFQRRALPTSAVNLQSGAIYNSSGTPTIVP
jgi:hypothetical protein